mmetsp:Transcript_68303/g.188993  ORF Transcript_68303/g.188993 Transcript_68303/m.188993 type:complete len:333 (-) Transcript_68303:76-1074(-)
MQRARWHLAAVVAWQLTLAHDFCRSREQRLVPVDDNVKLDHVHVAFSTDASNFAGLLTAMISLTHHLASPGSCSIHVVVPPDELLKAEALVRCFRHETGTLPGTPAIILHELRPLPFPLAYYQVPLAIYWTRVFLHEYLPTAPRVIWLDHDTVIRADLSELYKMRMEHALAGAPEFVQPHLVRMMTFRDHIRECPHVTHYMGGTLMDSATFNTGILVFDLNKWRSGAFARSVADWAVIADGCFLDQLALNLAFRGSWDSLDWRWNARFNGTVATPAHCVQEVRIFHWNTYPNPKYWMSCSTSGHTGDEHLWKPYTARQECEVVNAAGLCPGV